MNGDPFLPSDIQNPFQSQHFIQAPVLTNQAFSINPEFFNQSHFRHPLQTQSTYGFGSDVGLPSEEVPPKAGPATHQGQYTHPEPGRIHQLLGTPWKGKHDPEFQELWGSYPPPFTELGSIEPDRVPSLDRNSLVGSLSYDSPPEIAAVYGASQWLQNLPVDWSHKESHAQLLASQEFNSQFFEPVHTSAQEPILDALEAQHPEIFPNHQSYSVAAPNTDSLYCFFSSQVSNIQSEENETALPHLPPTGINSSSGDSAVDITRGFSPDSETDFNVVVAAPFSSATPWNHEGSWNCFVMEDGSGMPYTAPEARRKGIRKGRLTARQRRLIAERRKQGNTCMRCRFSRVAVCLQSQLLT